MTAKRSGSGDFSAQQNDRRRRKFEDLVGSGVDMRESCRAVRIGDLAHRIPVVLRFSKSKHVKRATKRCVSALVGTLISIVELHSYLVRIFLIFVNGQ